MKDLIVVILGAGEMASGIAHRLHSSGFKRIVMTEIDWPLAVRRKVSFCEAVYDGAVTVEGLTARLAAKDIDISDIWDNDEIAIIVDPEGRLLQELRADVLIDAMMTKRTKARLAGLVPLVIGVGPGFSAPETVDVVIESNRGHNMGRVIYRGEAEAYSGVPGNIGGQTAKRVLRAPGEGMVRTVKHIGDLVKEGEIVLYVNDAPVMAQIDGVLRGAIRPIAVVAGEKVGDVDPRGNADDCATISDKARAIAGGALEAILHRYNTKQDI